MEADSGGSVRLGVRGLPDHGPALGTDVVNLESITAAFRTRHRFEVWRVGIRQFVEPPAREHGIDQPSEKPNHTQHQGQRGKARTYKRPNPQENKQRKHDRRVPGMPAETRGKASVRGRPFNEIGAGNQVGRPAKAPPAAPAMATKFKIRVRTLGTRDNGNALFIIGFEAIGLTIIMHRCRFSKLDVGGDAPAWRGSSTPPLRNMP